MSDYLKIIQEKLGYQFKDIALLKLALTHSSYINEKKLPEHNERLEFLGDAVLELFISNRLYHKHTKEREGTLTNLRSKMVNEKSLSKIAKELSIGQALYMGKGEVSQGGRMRPALLADALEAIIGAIFLDGGYKNVNSALERIFKNTWPEPQSCLQKKSYKTLLQEYTQAHFQFTPEYQLISEEGPEHAKIFTVAFVSPSHKPQAALKTIGVGQNVKFAEHEAAKIALEKYTHSDLA